MGMKIHPQPQTGKPLTALVHNLDSVSVITINTEPKFETYKSFVGGNFFQA